MKILRLMYLGMKNICGNFCCKQTSMRKVTTLAFFASISTWCIWTYDAYMLRSARKVLRH